MPGNKPNLNEVPLPGLFPEAGKVYITISPGQWDDFIEGAYERGHTLLEIQEVNGVETAVKAYNKSGLR